MRGINLNYGQLTAKERFNLTISALMRGDFKEADRLYDTCPKYDYTMADKEYTCRLHIMSNINSIFSGECVYYYSNAAKLDSELQREGKRQEDLDDDIIERYEARDSNIRSLKALYRGFSEFCNQVGIEAAEALKIMGIERCCPDIQTYLDFDDTDPPDPDEIERFKDMFLGYWGL